MLKKCAIHSFVQQPRVFAVVVKSLYIIYFQIDKQLPGIPRATPIQIIIQRSLTKDTLQMASM